MRLSPDGSVFGSEMNGPLPFRSLATDYCRFVFTSADELESSPPKNVANITPVARSVQRHQPEIVVWREQRIHPGRTHSFALAARISSKKVPVKN
jgi:hypothetical protein